MIHSKFYLKARALKKAGELELSQKWYTLAIQQGDVKGYYGLVLLAEEIGKDSEKVKKMYADCFQPIKNLALDGDCIAASIIGIYYAMGLGNIEQNSEMAHIWFLVGAMGNDEVAQFNLAIHYYLGITIEKDTNKALQLLKKAMEKHYDPATELYNEIIHQKENNQ